MLILEVCKYRNMLPSVFKRLGLIGDGALFEKWVHNIKILLFTVHYLAILIILIKS